MQSNTAILIEREVEARQDLPNKCKYPLFAGLQGEKYLTDILRLILPRALFNTWQIFLEEQAYGNEMYLSQPKLAEKAGRAQRTIRKHLAELRGKQLMIERIAQKTFLNRDGTLRIKTVVVKDFEGLYDLAYEYHCWIIDPAHIEPDPELMEAVRQDEKLMAKLRRFDHYRKLLYNELPGPAPQPRAYPWFTEYQAENADKPVEQAYSEKSNTHRQVYLPKDLPKDLPKETQERINDTDQNNSRNGDSLESEKDFEKGGSGAGGYRKRSHQNEKGTNPIPTSPQKNVLPSAGKTRESDECHLNMQEARGAMVVAGVEPGRKRSARCPQAQEELLPPPRNPLARSFIDIIAAPFGDSNVKGTKTGIERSIETFELGQSDIVLCLVRAMQVAKTSKIRKENINQAGVANRMKLYCHMFKEFARARASGGSWDYNWEQMLDDLAADDLFAEWIVAHQAELEEDSEEAVTEEAGAVEDGQDGVTGEKGEESRAPMQLVEAEAVFSTNDPEAGWPTQAGADNRGEHLLNEIDPYRTTYTWMSRPTPYGRWGFVILKRRGRMIVERCLNNADIARVQAQLPRGGSTYQF